MLKGFYIAFALALLVATTAFAWGQTSQQPQPQAQQAQNQPTSDQRGTEQAPFIVKAAPKSEAEAAADAKEREEKSRLDRQLVKYTLYLAIIALLQFGALIAQAVFVAWTIVHGRRVERAYVSGGGAFLEIRGIDAKTGEPTSQMTDTFQLTVDNYGKTPARVFNVKLGFVTQPTFPPFIYVRNELLSAVIPPNAEGRFTPVRLRRNQIAGDTIFGRFTYETVFRRRFRLPRRQHHAGFILHITPTLGVEPINPPRAYTDWN